MDLQHQKMVKYAPNAKVLQPQNSSATANGRAEIFTPEGWDFYTRGQSNDRCNRVIYIENKCGSNIHPWFRDYPKDATRLVVDKDRNSMAYFSFDEVNEQIVHFGGMLIHPKGGSVDPPTGVEMVLHSDNHDGAKFTMVPSPYPQPELTGHWERLFAVINPVGEHTYTINFKIGKSMTKEATEKVHWKVSANLALNWFKANGEYEKYATLAKSETWEVEVDSSYSLKVLPGPTVVTWQWVFDAERLDESYRFRSTILGDTNDLNTPPEI